MEFININAEAIKKEIGIFNFKQTRLLEIALTHPSYLNEVDKFTQEKKDCQKHDYRRLATLGDSILGAAVIEYLYHEIPSANQGDLSQFKSNLVSRNRTGQYALKLNLKQLCLLSRGEKRKDESEQIELFGEMFEALLGAIYLEFERDFTKTSTWLINRVIKDTVDEIFDDLAKNKFDSDNE